MNRTDASVRVARALLADPDGEHYGWPLTKAANVKSGALYPILARMEQAGWLSSDWQESENGRPPRRYYRIADRAALTEYVEGK